VKVGKQQKERTWFHETPTTLSSTYGPDPLKSFLDQLSHNEAKSLKKSFSLLRAGIPAPDCSLNPVYKRKKNQKEDKVHRR